MLLHVILVVFVYGDEFHKKTKIWPDSDQAGRTWPIEEESQNFWREKTRKEIDRAKSKKINFKKAKNVILFLGDGMGMPTDAVFRRLNLFVYLYM